MARGVLNSSDSTPEIAPPGGFPGPLSFRTWLDALTSGGGPAWLSVEGGARVDVSKELMDFRGLWRQVFNRQNMSSQSEAASTPTHTEWMGVVSWQPGEELLQAEDMIHWLTPTRVELGTLVMTDRRVLFVVTGKAGATIRFSLLANQVSKSNEHCEGDGQLVFSAGEECRVFTPEAGRRSVRSF